MADSATPVADPAAPPVGTEQIAAIQKQVADISEIVTKLAKPVYPGGRSPAEVLGGGPRDPARAPYGTSGPVGQDSAGYSLMKAAGYCQGFISADTAKEEIEVSKRLRSIYDKMDLHYQSKGFLVPTSTNLIPTRTEQGQEIGETNKFVGELKQKMHASLHRAGGFDPDEASWLNERTNGAFTKALGTISDSAGGSLIGFPALGELIDLQRNMEVFPSAGATEIALPPNGRIAFPKLMNGATFAWTGEAASTSTSQPTTGQLLLEGKKGVVIVPVNNELFRYTPGGSAEGMIRLDIARVCAIGIDLAFLQGTGGTQPLGILNYPTTTSWAVGTDKLIAHTSVGTPADANSGYPFQPEDVLLMDGKLPDAVDKGTAWIVRKDWFAYILNRRGDSAMPGDGKGPFLFDVWRSISDGRPNAIADTKVVRSRQVSNTRTRGSGSAFTFTLLGYFPDWIIARHGVMEFLANPYDSTAYSQDQTLLRGIQIVDGGARHPASFVLCDQLALS